MEQQLVLFHIKNEQEACAVKCRSDLVEQILFVLRAFVAMALKRSFTDVATDSFVTATDTSRRSRCRVQDYLDEFHSDAKLKAPSFDRSPQDSVATQRLEQLSRASGSLKAGRRVCLDTHGPWQLFSFLAALVLFQRFLYSGGHCTACCRCARCSCSH